MILQAGIERALAGMAEWRMAEVVRQRQRFGQVLVQTQLACQRTGDLRHLQRVGQPGAVMVTLMEDEHLRLVLEAAERGRMDHPVAIAAKGAAVAARRLIEAAAAAQIGVAAVRCGRRRPSHGHWGRSFGV